MSSSTRNISLIIDGISPKEFVLELIAIEKSVRISRALKSLVIFWTCAGFSIFIPMLHFVLVPGFFLAGLFFAANSYFDDLKLKTTKIPCSKCGSEAEFKNLSDQFPKWAVCSSCGAEHRAELKKYTEL